jgi:hypothetical protein
MKIWNGYGSEHSANLVMIGHFKELRDAEKVMEAFARLEQQVAQESERYGRDRGPEGDRYSDAMLDLLREEHLWTISAAELEQFEYGIRVARRGSDVVVTTDEMEVSAFMKALVERGARVELYSAHDYPDVSTRNEGA